MLCLEAGQGQVPGGKDLQFALAQLQKAAAFPQIQTPMDSTAWEGLQGGDGSA